MDNAVLAGDSSSANVNFTVLHAEYTSSDMLTVTLSEGVCFTTRLTYFKNIPCFSSFPFAFSELQYFDFITAVRSFQAEQQALIYLNRAEHSAYQLKQKLSKKGFLPHEYEPACSYLIRQGFIDDRRFAEAWLHTRCISKNEGYMRLLAELQKRGIDSAIAQQVLESFFSETDEAALCTEAYRQCLRRGYDREKAVRSLQRKGFSFFLIKKTINQITTVEYNE